jgi:hypothetical protein
MLTSGKIKHVDEETGQIKENVWEFQHPNFQSGGKADLDSIKVRKKTSQRRKHCKNKTNAPSVKLLFPRRRPRKRPRHHQLEASPTRTSRA